VISFLPDETRLSQVCLRTADLERALRFYAGTLGFQIVKPAGGSRLAGVSPTGNAPAMIVLHEDRRAAPRPPGTTGLCHFAIRYPTRLDLAHALQRTIQNKHPIQGASDHGVSEAIYLNDPDANGVELYVDRPPMQWQWRNGEVAMPTEPLDIDNLLALAESRPVPSRVAPQADLGHIHLHAADLAAAGRFYHEYLGLGVTRRSCPGALFLSAGGYHHHLAVNTWAGDQPPPRNSIGLVSYSLDVPEAEVLYCLRHRAPLAGYDATTEIGEAGSECLRILDPNGQWLEVRHTPLPHRTSADRTRHPLSTRG
jgi:catechol 2,3-dioxygenase